MVFIVCAYLAGKQVRLSRLFRVMFMDRSMQAVADVVFQQPRDRGVTACVPLIGHRDRGHIVMRLALAYLKPAGGGACLGSSSTSPGSTHDHFAPKLDNYTSL